MPRLSAWENVAVPLIYAGVSSKEREERAWAMLEKVGLQERGKHLPNELSGGQSQRVAIARALINNPSLIPVSYTHLDVYKRQLCSLSNN